MRVLGLVTVAFAAFSAAQEWDPVLSANSSIVQKHMLARSNMITLEKRQRQGATAHWQSSTVMHDC